MLSLPSPAPEFAAQILGSAVPVPSSGQQTEPVIRVRDDQGAEYIVKQHGSETRHAREDHAYQQWTRALCCNAPELVAANSLALTIVVTALPSGADGHSGAVGVHRQAGALLRAFHAAAKPHPLPGYRDWLADRAH